MKIKGAKIAWLGINRRLFVSENTCQISTRLRSPAAPNNVVARWRIPLVSCLLQPGTMMGMSATLARELPEKLGTVKWADG